MPKQIIASLTVDKAELTLPENTITLDTSGSYFLNNQGERVAKQFVYIFTGPGTITQSGSVAIVTDLPEGNHIFTVDVENKGETASGTAFASVTVKAAETKTIYGAKLQGSFDEQLAAARKLGVTHMRVNSVQMKGFNGDISGIKKWYDAGFKILLNVIWVDQNPSTFPTGADLETYKINFALLVSLTSDMVEIYFCENEQTQEKTFYDYTKTTIVDYLRQLQAHVDICEAANVLCSDGGLHIKVLDQVMQGNLKKENAQRQLACINYYKSITYPGFKVNVHIEFENDSYEAGLIPKVVNWIVSQTACEVVTNEFHTIKCSATFLKMVYGEWAAAKVKVVGVWGGNQVQGQPDKPGSEADAINVGAELTALGEAVREVIKG